MLRLWLGIAVACLVLSGVSAQAATIHVPGDYPTVLAGVDAAVSGDTVLVGPGVWTETDTRFGIKALAFPGGGVTIASSSGPEATTIDISVPGSGTIAIYYANADEDVVIEGFSFTGRTPDMDGGTFVVGSLASGLHVIDCRFLDNGTDLSGLDGTGVGVGDCKLIMEDCEFVGNSTYGGLVRVGQSDAEIRGCEFRENVGIGIQALDDEQSVGNTEWLIEDCRFLDNTTARCVFLTGGPFVVRGCEFLRNSSASAGAGIYAWPELTEGVIEFCTFVKDSSFVGGTGAGIYAREGDLEVRNNTFYGNYSEFTGGACIMVANGATVQAEANIFSYSTGTAAVRVFEGTYSATCNDYWANSGGDFWNTEAGPLDFAADPLFCDPENLNFTLSASSPCAPDLSPCGLIGAWDVGCGTVSIDRASWGSIKAQYR